MAGAELRFGVLGPLRVERDGESVDLPRSGVIRGLLGVLLAADGQPLPAARLLELVWADRDGGIGRGAVQVAISRLRRWLAGLTGGREAAAAVSFATGGYRLSLPPGSVDLARFRALLADADRTGDPAARCDLLGAAVGLVRGPVLVDLVDMGELNADDPLLRGIDDQVRVAGLAFGTAALAAGRPRAAVGWAEAQAGRDGLDEQVHALWIDLLSAQGWLSEALGVYERLRGRLAEELGISPSQRVQEAHLAVLAKDRDLVGAEGAG